MVAKKINVITEKDETPLSLEILEKEIQKLANIGKQIEKSRLTRRTITLLLQDMTKISKNQIHYILNALPLLEEKYLKPKKSVK